MKELEDRIRKDGIVREGNVLKVDNFLNHQCEMCIRDRHHRGLGHAPQRGQLAQRQGSSTY